MPYRPCNPTAIGLPVCPSGALTTRTRCERCERVYEQQRNARPERVALYTPEWAAHSRKRRTEQPWCSACQATTDLTVDHPTDDVLCRSCHLRLEGARRRAT